jgi:hypothetical protein
MKGLASVLVLLAVVGAGRAGEKEILKQLEGLAAGEAALVRCTFDGEDDSLVVYISPRCPASFLSALCELHHLRALIVVNPDGVPLNLHGIVALTQLRALSLEGCPLTVANLERVQRLRELELLVLRNAQVTDADIARLRKALPKCQIER